LFEAFKEKQKADGLNAYLYREAGKLLNYNKKWNETT
jgi:hypothetical protein